MCYRTTCEKCQRPTYGGCGQHIESALAGVPQNERCQCNKKEVPVPRGASSKAPSWLPSVFGRTPR